MDFFIPLAGFAIAAMITPGPNTLMVAASGVNFGFARTCPHIAGICVGFSLMMYLFGVGLGTVLIDHPHIHHGMRYVAFAFLCWIAWRIARAGWYEGDTRHRPLSFMEAALFQWVNPKAWFMAAAATTMFMGAGAAPHRTAGAIAAVFFLLCIPCASVWTLGGAAAARHLKHHPRRLRMFNITMAVLLVATMLPVLWV